MSHILLRHRDEGLENIHQLDVYRANGGYDALKKVLDEYSKDEVITIVRDSNLRGRGGAGSIGRHRRAHPPPD